MITLNNTYQFSLNKISEIATQIINIDSNNKVFMLEGEMGSGKTTLIKEICKALGSTDHMSSPTFSIVNEYKYTGGKIFHFDLYRLKNLEELLDIGFEDYVYSQNYCLIEWPQLAERYLQNQFIKINISTSENIRYLRASKV